LIKLDIHLPSFLPAVVNEILPNMVLKRIKKAILFTRLFGYVFRLYVSFLGRTVSVRLAGLTTRTSSPPVDPSEVKNIVVVGAAFAGYFAARTLAWSLPRDGRYRVVVIEPNSHFNFTWVLPRFCVVEGHEHKAFIPYTPDFFAKGPKGMVRWIRDRVVSVRRESVVLRSGEEVPYQYLIIATGSTVADGLPSRVGVEDKEGGVELLRAMQSRIKVAEHVVVAGGGAAGVELATDAKNQYPDKSITLVHSRGAVMHRFGPGLQKAAMDALQTLGVDVILNEKADPTSADGKFITLSSGRKIECDCFVGFLCTLHLWEHLTDTDRQMAADQLHGTETGIRSHYGASTRGYLPLGPHPCQAHPPDRRRLPQHLCLWRRGRHQGAEPQLADSRTSGRDCCGQRGACCQGEEAEVHVQDAVGGRCD
jgi:thioredoxin reductase